MFGGEGGGAQTTMFVPKAMAPNFDIRVFKQSAGVASLGSRKITGAPSCIA
jgi:hypothetical protein